MYISYDKLWKILIDRHMKKTDLIKEVGISTNTLSRLSKNEFVKMETITKIALYFDVQISDIVYISKCAEERCNDR